MHRTMLRNFPRFVFFAIFFKNLWEVFNIARSLKLFCLRDIFKSKSDKFSRYQIVMCYCVCLSVDNVFNVIGATLMWNAI